MARKWQRIFFMSQPAEGEPQLLSGPAYRGLALVRIETGVWRLASKHDIAAAIRTLTDGGHDA